jgi:protoporphyrinogen oxidase
MDIGIIGAGITGLTTACELGEVGHRVTIFEKAEQPGGLAATFRDPSWEWPLERFYHHLFASDDVVLDISRQLGLGDKIFFPRPITAIWQNGSIGAFDSAPAVLRYPHLSLPEKMRVGLVILYLRMSRNWQPLEEVTAHEWLPRYTGREAYEALLEPLLVGKFGDCYKEVNMAWLWARFHKRSPRLGYYVGGYQTLIDALVDKVQAEGGVVSLSTPISRIDRAASRIRLHVEDGTREFDAVVATVAPQTMVHLAGTLPGDYLGMLRGLRSVGALTLVLALRQQVTDRYYWISLPRGQFPFLAFVEHTNYQSPAHYGGDHLIYLGDYPAADHRYFRMGKDELLTEFLPSLKAFNAQFDLSWVRRSWLFREAYAQPVVPVNYSKQIPPVRTPVPGLYYASMNHVYPWDRGANYAVEMGQKLARLVMDDAVGDGTE